MARVTATRSRLIRRGVRESDLSDEASGTAVSRFLGRETSRFDQLPKFGILLQGFIFLQLESRAIQKVFQGVTAKDAMNDEAELVSLEVNAVIANPKAMED